MDQATVNEVLFEYQQRVRYHDGDHVRALQDLKTEDLQVLKAIANDISDYRQTR